MAASALAIVLGLPSIGSTALNIEGVTPKTLPDFDARAKVGPTTKQVAAAKRLGARVVWNSFGTPLAISKTHGYLATGLAAPDAAAAARAYISAHRDVFGLASTAGLRVGTAEPMRGTTNDFAVVFRQAFGSALSSDGVATVGVVRRHGAWNVTYVSSTLSRHTGAVQGASLLTPVAAFSRAAAAARHPIAMAQVTLGSRNTDGSRNVIATGMAGTQTIRPVAFATPRLGALRAYEATVTGAQSQYQVIVDGATGKLLYRQNQEFNLTDDPEWSQFPIAPAYNPMNAFPWNYPSTDTRRIVCWTATAGCTYVASDNPATTVYPMGVASKFPWDVPMDVAGTQSTPQSTVGNNNDEALQWSGGGRSYNNPANPRPISATRDYTAANFPFTNQWFNSKCDPAPLTATGQAGAQANPNVEDWSAAAINLFVGHNQMHDFSYYLGFDEGHWNMQQYNNGVTTNDPTPTPGGPTIAAPLGNDAVLGQVQQGAISGGPPAYGSRDNANMGTGADGQHPSTNMFLWQPLPGAFYAPCVDGAYDFTVFGHEFGHAIENRMIGKGVGSRQGFPAGAMGEAFGDFDALEFVNEAHVAPVPGSDRYTEGAYATGNGYNGIRDFLAGRPMGGAFPTPSHNPDTDPLNYSDIGFDNVGPEVHADGEVWVAIQMDLRDLFLTRYPSSSTAQDIACLRGQQSSNTCPGDRRWIQDYYDAMVLMPRNPTMQDARDAMLAADLGRFGGANQDLLWQGFAMRGLGQFAQTNPNVGTSGNATSADTDPTPDFSSPTASNATLTFTAVAKDASTLPVNAKIYVGDYSARATQVADTDPGTNPTAGTPRTGNLDNTAQFVPNGSGSLTGKDARWTYYNFTAVAPGYGIVRFSAKNLRAGETRNITIHFPTNYASSSQSATITGDALGTNTTLENAIDDNEATNDGQTGASAQGRWSVIKLGDIPATGVRVKTLGVSALLVPGNNRFTALRSFDAYACRAGKVAANPTCDGSIDAGWTKILTSPTDSFPSVNPRPVTPDETLRYFDVTPTVATHVKFVVTNNQCTGQTSYQGDQDNDPNINSDCRVTQAPTATGFPPRNTEVHTNEIEVFGSSPTVDGTLVNVGG